MDSKQIRVVLCIMALVVFVWLISPFLFSRREPPRPPSTSPLSFDASRAYAATEEFVRRSPRRVLGSLESRQSTGYLHDRLQELGYSILYTHFDARIARRKQVGRNVLGFKQGQIPETLALVAHFDTAPTTVQGAMDNGSGVGVLLELARVFAAIPTHHSLLIIFSDGGEYGSLGARDVAASYPGRNRIAAVLSLDHVGPGDLAALTLESTGQMNGFASPWLRQLSSQAAAAQGLPVKDVSGIKEHFERAFLISGADQGPFLRAGIPAINLGSISVVEARQKAIYHSPQDTIENLKAASFGAFGLAAERIVRTLDELQSMPQGSPESLRLWDARYWRPQTGVLLHTFAFLPLAASFWFCAKNRCGKLSTAAIRRELLISLGTALPFWAFLLSISLARALRLLPTYTLYAATAKDPVLLNIPWNVLGSILGAALFVAVVCSLIGILSVRSLPKPDFYASKLVLLGLMILIVVLALIYNSYWAIVFLLLPAWVWALVGSGKNTGEQIRNAAWILAAGIPFGLAMWTYCARLGLSWNFLWYQVIALGSGMFTTAGFYLGIASISIGIRFLVIQFRENAA
ncbi:MAG: aminopeptidase [Acidobacteria bacterium]|nr:aminopeptidase [Acidobacteriota bacterium]